MIMSNSRNLSKISGADAFQVRSVSQERFVKKIGKSDKDTMKKIRDALKEIFEI